MSLFTNALIAFVFQAGVTSAKRGWLSACLETYPGYTGDIDLSDGSKVFIKFVNKKISFKFVGKGGERNCVDCGVHIHTGTTCSDADLVGGHYWDDLEGTKNDPWNSANGAVYKSNPEGMSKAKYVIKSGYNIVDNVGHAVVVHGKDGSRIGCGVLSKSRSAANNCSVKKTYLQACITKYPGYTGNLDIHGKAVVRFEHESMMFNGELDGVDVLCDKCGIHIHSGTTCDDADLVGGHYWDDNNNLIPDPWNADGPATYSSLSDGRAYPTFYLNAGYDAQENIGHAVVVHDNEGARYGCGVLFSTSTFEGSSCPDKESQKVDDD